MSVLLATLVVVVFALGVGSMDLPARAREVGARSRDVWTRSGNLLLVESAAGRVVEAAPDGRTLWEWIVEPYEDWGVPSVTGAERVEVTREDMASWPCGTG